MASFLKDVQENLLKLSLEYFSKFHSVASYSCAPGQICSARLYNFPSKPCILLKKQRHHQGQSFAQSLRITRRQPNANTLRFHTILLCFSWWCISSSLVHFSFHAYSEKQIQNFSLFFCWFFFFLKCEELH